MAYIVAGLIVNSLSLYVADLLIDGIKIENFGALVVSAIAIAIVNTFIKPLAHLIALPITVITLGLFALVVNTAMLGLAAWFVPGFHINGFFDAFWGAIIISLVSRILSLFFEPKKATA
ncbi:MAG TPA: phage holin family protein [Candidatus Saccharimonadales bacterium]|nr:phage holin family protein [Candidatus Saccharimonadales bacterium]